MGIRNWRRAAFPVFCGVLYIAFLLRADALCLFSSTKPPHATVGLTRPSGLGHSAAAGRQLAVAEGATLPPRRPPSRHEAPSAATLDGAGNLYVTGSSCLDADCAYATVKYDPAGRPLWSAGFAELAGENAATALGSDGEGNVYVTGYAQNAGGGRDVVTLKYDPAGRLLWRARYRGVTDNSLASALAVGDDGSVYVAGSPFARYQPGEGSGVAYAILKYAADGQLLWEAEDDWEGATDDVATGLRLGRDGSVFLTGHSRGDATGLDFATLKYDAAGRLLWAARYSSPGEADDVPSALFLDDAGNAYVAGTSRGAAGLGHVAVKYDALGVLLWSVVEGPSASGVNALSAFAVDHAGGVYVASFAGQGADSTRYATVKYDAAGQECWRASLTVPALSLNPPSSLALDDYGNAYVGVRAWLDGRTAPAIAKYDADGTLTWVAPYASAMRGSESSLLVDPSGGFYLVGRPYDDGDTGYVVLKYDGSGRPLSVAGREVRAEEAGS